MEYEVDLSNGLGEVRFGMRPSEVENILGPDQIFEDWMGGNLEGFYFYKGLLIGFSGGSDECPDENSEVCLFTVKPEHDLILWGINISRCSISELKDLLVSEKIDYKLIGNNIVQSESGKLQFNYSAAGNLDEFYFEQH